jgi:hypothetical protein
LTECSETPALSAPFEPGDRVAFGFPSRVAYRVHEMKPYQGVDCGWLASLEGYGIPWVDAGGLIRSSAPLYLGQIAQRPLTEGPTRPAVSRPAPLPSPTPPPPEQPPMLRIF